MQPHQQRVVDEKADLDAKHTALARFFETEIFKNLDEAEQQRLARQIAYMSLYSQVLGERIAAF